MEIACGLHNFRIAWRYYLRAVLLETQRLLEVENQHFLATVATQQTYITPLWPRQQWWLDP
jgi:hypothetical protein